MNRKIVVSHGSAEIQTADLRIQSGSIQNLLKFKCQSQKLQQSFSKVVRGYILLLKWGEWQNFIPICSFTLISVCLGPFTRSEKVNTGFCSQQTKTFKSLAQFLFAREN